MVVRENEVRTSPETQKRFSAAEMTGETDWMEIALLVNAQARGVGSTVLCLLWRFSDLNVFVGMGS